jgi:uncharacterized Zn-finger protein
MLSKSSSSVAAAAGNRALSAASPLLSPRQVDAETLLLTPETNLLEPNVAALVTAGDDDECPHKCTFCAKAFLHRWMLERHLTRHTGAQPYSCTKCGRRFSLQGSASRHVKNVHGVARSPNSLVVRIEENGEDGS